MCMTDAQKRLESTFNNAEVTRSILLLAAQLRNAFWDKQKFNFQHFLTILKQNFFKIANVGFTLLTLFDSTSFQMGL